MKGRVGHEFAGSLYALIEKHSTVFNLGFECINVMNFMIS